MRFREECASVWSEVPDGMYFWRLSRQGMDPCLFLVGQGCCYHQPSGFGIEALFSNTFVLTGQLWLKSSCLLNFFFYGFRYRSLDTMKLRP